MIETRGLIRKIRNHRHSQALTNSKQRVGHTRAIGRNRGGVETDDRIVFRWSGSKALVNCKPLPTITGNHGHESRFKAAQRCVNAAPQCCRTEKVLRFSQTSRTVEKYHEISLPVWSTPWADGIFVEVEWNGTLERGGEIGEANEYPLI